MLTNLHFIRPWWLLGLLFLALLVFFLYRSKAASASSQALCDEHLLPYLLEKKGTSKHKQAIYSFIFAASFFCIALAGPSWHKIHIPAYRSLEAKVIVLDLSDKMLDSDLKPDRLTRAKFKLHDIFNHKAAGLFGLVVFTGDAFVVSPLTEDSKTIDALVSSLTPEIMPLEGYNLPAALNQAADLIKQAGFAEGDILVLTATTPDKASLDTAAKLSAGGMKISVMPIQSDPKFEAYQQLAQEGRGLMLPFSLSSKLLDKWLSDKLSSSMRESKSSKLEIWQDQGRWFLLPALLLLLPAFRRNWLQRIEL